MRRAWAIISRYQATHAARRSGVGLLVVSLVAVGALLFVWGGEGRAAVGDYAIYREATGLETIGTSNVTLDFDTPVTESAGFSINGANNTVTLADPGHYLVLYNFGVESTGGSNRSEIQGRILQNGSPIAYGRGTCYIRRTDGTDECLVSASAIIETTGANETISIQAQRTDANTATVRRRANEAGLTILRLDTVWDYARIRKTDSLTVPTAFTPLVWTTNDELDPASFSRSGSAITLTDPGHYLVTANVMFRNSGTGRRIYNMRLALDGVELPGVRTSAYIRGTDSTQDHAATYVGIIEATSSGQVVTLEVGCGSAACGAITTVADQAAISIAKLPDTAEYVQLYEAGGGLRTDTVNEPITWDTQQQVDATAFSHSTSSNSENVTIERDGDYLFLGSFWGNGGTTNNVRQYPSWAWHVDGGPYQYGSFGKYKRGFGDNDAGASHGILLNGLTMGSAVSLRNTNLSSDNDPNSIFVGERYAVQGVRLDTLIPEDVVVRSRGTQTTSITIPSTQTHVGGAFALSASRDTETITGITVTESGTVNGQNALDNIRLRYDLDTSAPYDCASESYSALDSQFGALDTNGFSGPDGVSSFTGSVNISTTSTMCVYVVVDVLSNASNGQTIELSIDDPSTEVSVLAGAVDPDDPVAIDGVTTLTRSVLRQAHYHWRLDNGTETTASSATGGVEDTPLTTLAKGSARRLRLGIGNTGGAAAPASTYRIEYAANTGLCSTSIGWVDVGAVGGDWDIATSTNLTEGTNTTNIGTSTGGVSDDGRTFLVANGGVRDETSQTGSLALAANDQAEFEFSLRSTPSAIEGTTYCFRASRGGTPLDVYDAYPEVTIIADLLVSATGTQVAALDKSMSGNYLGGGFVITDTTPGDSHLITEITLAEAGTVDGSTGLENIELYYDLDTTAPHDCTGESFGGGEAQFGATDGNGFSGPNGVSTFTDSLEASSTQAICLYPVMDITTLASNGETIELEITNPQTDVDAGGAAVAPNVAVEIPGATTIQGETLDQFGFHWRNDDGNETGATSMTGGVEDTPFTNVVRAEPHRLRVGVHNTGLATSAPKQLRLEYAENPGSCGAASGWSDVGDTGGDWDMALSDNIVEATNTTDIPEADGGLTNPPSGDFEVSNGGVRESTSETGALTLSPGEFVELEYSIEATSQADLDTDYCFRLTDAGSPLEGYSTYAQGSIRPNQDFFVQRGTTTIDVGSTTKQLVAGVDYVVPRTPSRAYVRLTVTHETGAGLSTGGTGNQNVDDVTVYITNPNDFASGIEFARFGTVDDTYLAWEIIEYIGPTGGDNEIVVHYAAPMTMNSVQTSTSTPPLTSITNKDNVAVFITAAAGDDTGTAYNTTQTTASYSSSTDQATLVRDLTGGDTAAVSVAVVEFRGSNWSVQRIEHAYVSDIVDEPEPISLTDTSRAFIHTQKRSGTDANLEEFGQEVWIASTTEILFRLEPGADNPGLHTGVAWVIENLQASGDVMEVTRFQDTHNEPTSPTQEARALNTTLDEVTAASMFMNNRVSGTGSRFPRPMISYSIISTTQFEFFVSDAVSQTRTYRVEVVEWPTAQRTLTQNYYQFFVNNDALLPTDAWPEGLASLGEFTAITPVDEPPGPGQTLRIRMSVQVAGGVLTAAGAQFRLQWVERAGSCSASTGWKNLGLPGSSSAPWRGFNASPADGAALSGDPPTVGDLILSVGDRAGTYEEDGLSVVNPYRVAIGEDVVYDWVVQNNGATESTYYCFRMVRADQTTLDDYVYYPTLYTSGFSLESGSWQWFDDATSTTPTVALAASNTAPTDLTYNNEIKLRIMVAETSGSSGFLKSRLQFSETSDFSGEVFDVVDADQCVEGQSLFCYADGGGVEHETIPSAIFAEADACVAGVGDGCGTHNERSFVPQTVGEVGTALVGATPVLINLTGTYENPVVIAEAITGDSTGAPANDPAAAIITATSATSFTVRVAEPDNELDDHGLERVSYLVMEAGDYVLPGGVLVDAGLAELSEYYGNAVVSTSDATCTFAQAFTAPPVLLTALQSDNNTSLPDFLTASQYGVTAGQFTCAIEVPDGETREPAAPEVFGWVALDAGMFGNNDLDLVAATTSTLVTGWTDIPWYAEAFDFDTFMGDPLILASKQTRNGAEGGWVRYEVAAPTSTSFAIDERDDGERTHTNERVGYLATSDVGVLSAEGPITFEIQANAAAEHEFTVRHAGAPGNRTYFFRLYDTLQNTPIPPNGSSSYPSLTTEGASLSFSIAGVSAGSSTEGIVTDVQTSATSVPFGNLNFGTSSRAAQRLTVSTNAPRGYQILLGKRMQFMSDLGGVIPTVAASNTAPLSWSSACDLTAFTGCWGYHAGDNTLGGGSTRFLLDDSYAAFSLELEEVVYSGTPVEGESHDIVYRVEVSDDQPPGQYSTSIQYIIIPTF